MTSGRPPLSPDDADGLVASLTRHLAEARVADAAAARARRRGIEEAGAGDATFSGVLLDLAERGARVVVTGLGGRAHQGWVRAVGEDVSVLATPAGPLLLRHSGVRSVRAEGPSVAGEARGVSLELRFDVAVAALAADRPWVRVVALDGTALSGDLRSVGLDVAVLRLSGEGGTAHVPLAAVTEVLVAG